MSTSSCEDAAVHFFCNRLKDTLDGKLRTLTLFGSRARADSDDSSDYDFIIVVSPKDNATLEIISEIQYEFLNRYDVPATGLVYSPEEWRIREGTPFGDNVVREGILLA